MPNLRVMEYEPLIYAMYLDIATDLLFGGGRINEPERIRMEVYQDRIFKHMEEKCKTPEMQLAMAQFREKITYDKRFNDSFVNFHTTTRKVKN